MDILKIRKRAQRNIQLRKSKSQYILNEICPYCSMNSRCDYVNSTGKYKLCKIQSNELDKVWILISNEKRKIEPNKLYGNIKPLYIKYKDNYGKNYWECEVTSNGKTSLKVIRYDTIFGNSQPVTLREKKYHRGSSTNPDGSNHAYPSEHSSRIGMSIDVLVIEEKDGKVKKYYKRMRCQECNGIVRYAENGYRICENCGLVME